MSKVVIGSSSVGFCALLTLIFITLKLTGYIAWSWIWVIAPLWIPATISFVISIVLFVILYRLTSKK